MSKSNIKNSPMPIPTSVLSNGEFDSLPQTKQQREVENLILKKSEEFSNELGISRKEFLLSTGGIVLSLLALNKVFGPFFHANKSEILDLATQGVVKKYKDQFIFDVQTHMISDDFSNKKLIRFAKWAALSGANPDLKKQKIDMDIFRLPNYVKEIFIDSETDFANLSGAPFENGDSISNLEIFENIAKINASAKSKIMDGYYTFNPLGAHALKELDNFVKQFRPIGWKLFPMGDPMSPYGKPWRLDDEKLVYPFYEKIAQLGIKTVCIHKGLVPRHYEANYPPIWKAAQVDDLAQASRDWPNINFVIFHSALRPFAGDDPSAELKQFLNNGRINWTSELVEIRNKSKVDNVYAELGTSFGSLCITHPELCAGFLGILLNELGEDRIIWGTDSIYYGSPQWQIEAFRRIHLPDQLMKKMNWSKNFGEENSLVRKKIFGLNAKKIFELENTSGVQFSNNSKMWIENLRNHFPEKTNKYYGHTKEE